MQTIGGHDFVYLIIRLQSGIVDIQFVPWPDNMDTFAKWPLGIAFTIQIEPMPFNRRMADRCCKNHQVPQ